ncbi:MAG: hypothetical protein AB7I04_08790 [Pseudomonadales bacterium]
MASSIMACVTCFAGDVDVRVVAADDDVRPLEELVAVLLRYAEELGQHLDRQLGGHTRDELALALILEPVQDRAGAAADARGERVELLRREAGRHHPPVLGVVRRVHGDHAAAALELGELALPLGELLERQALSRRDHLWARQGDATEPPVAREHVRTLGDGLDVVVLGDGPEARTTPGLRAPGDRLLAAETGKNLVDPGVILEGVGVGQGNPVFGADGHGLSSSPADG